MAEDGAADPRRLRMARSDHNFLPSWFDRGVVWRKYHALIEPFEPPPGRQMEPADHRNFSLADSPILYP